MQQDVPINRRGTPQALAPFLLLLTLCFAVPGCKQDLSTLLHSQGTLKVVIYESGQPSYQRLLEPNSREFRELVTWAERNSEGWKPNMITLKPGILLEGRDFKLIIRPEGAILIYDEGQFAKPISSDDYAHFYKLLGGLSVSGL